MSSSSQHEQFRRALIDAGIPRRRRLRLLDEYRDHWAELERELREAGIDSKRIDKEITARLGMPEVLAKVALERLRGETFAGRRPALGFTLLPLLSLILALATALATTLIPWIFVGQDRMVELLGAVWPVILYVLPVVGGVWWYRAALQRGRGHGYAWLGALVFGMPMTFLSTRVIHSDIPLRSVFQFVSEAVPSWTALALVVSCAAAWLATRRAQLET